MTKTPDELAHKTAYELGANNIEYELVKKAFMAGYLAAIEQRINQNAKILLERMHEQRKREWNDENT